MRSGFLALLLLLTCSVGCADAADPKGQDKRAFWTQFILEKANQAELQLRKTNDHAGVLSELTENVANEVFYSDTCTDSCVATIKLAVDALNDALGDASFPDDVREGVIGVRDQAMRRLAAEYENGKIALADVLESAARNAAIGNPRQLNDKQLAFVVQTKVMTTLFACRTAFESASKIKVALEAVSHAKDMPKVSQDALHGILADIKDDFRADVPIGSTWVYWDIVGRASGALNWSVGNPAVKDKAALVQYVLSGASELQDTPEPQLVFASTLALTDLDATSPIAEALRNLLYASSGWRANGVDLDTVSYEVFHDSPPAGDTSSVEPGSRGTSGTDFGGALNQSSVPQCPPDPRCPR